MTEEVHVRRCWKLMGLCVAILVDQAAYACSQVSAAQEFRQPTHDMTDEEDLTFEGGSGPASPAAVYLSSNRECVPRVRGWWHRSVGRKQITRARRGRMSGQRMAGRCIQDVGGANGYLCGARVRARKGGSPERGRVVPGGEQTTLPGGGVGLAGTFARSGTTSRRVGGVGGLPGSSRCATRGGREGRGKQRGCRGRPWSLAWGAMGGWEGE